MVATWYHHTLQLLSIAEACHKIISITFGRKKMKPCKMVFLAKKVVRQPCNGWHIQQLLYSPYMEKKGLFEFKAGLISVKITCCTVWYGSTY